jgi:hypothetical protein
MSPPALEQLRRQMEARVRQIDEQIKDALQKNPVMTPGRFGSVDWHTRARRAQDYYRRDILRIQEQIHILLTGATILKRGDKTNITSQSRAEMFEHKVNSMFRKTARIRLTETLYEGILKEAKEEAILAVQAEAQETGQ